MKFMLNNKFAFIKTTFKSSAYAASYTTVLSTLNALFNDIKMDDALPKAGQRDNVELFLIDGADKDWHSLLPAELICLAKQHKVILFNVEPNAVCEKNLLLNHFNGVFYSSDVAEDIFKALVRVTAGELWFTRKVISNAFKEILNAASSNNLLHDDIVLSKADYENLTKREKTVIHLIAQGASNDKIANKLNISDHTVKTHLYSAFKKTQSRNRIELANWAQRYISVLLPLES